jgi:hypothetical protein
MVFWGKVVWGSLLGKSRLGKSFGEKSFSPFWGKVIWGKVFWGKDVVPFKNDFASLFLEFGDRCYDFKNIFAQNRIKIWRLWLKLLLFRQKKMIITLVFKKKTPNFG